MGDRNLKRVADNKPRKRHILLLFACLAVVLGMGIYFLITDFSIQKIQISGNNTYTNAEIIEAMKEDGYIDNTLLMIAQNQIFDQTYLPFIEKVSMSYDDSHILKEYVYFNENGIAMESRNTLFEGVPVVTGVKFNEMNLKRKILENKVPVKKNYFNTIVSITKKITTYKLNVSEIHFEGEDDITLTSSKYKRYLGSSSYLDGKMSKLSSILETVSSNYKKGTIDMHLYTDDKPIVTFKENDK